MSGSGIGLQRWSPQEDEILVQYLHDSVDGKFKNNTQKHAALNEIMAELAGRSRVAVECRIKNLRKLLGFPPAVPEDKRRRFKPAAFDKADVRRIEMFNWCQRRLIERRERLAKFRREARRAAEG